MRTNFEPHILKLTREEQQTCEIEPLQTMPASLFGRAPQTSAGY